MEWKLLFESETKGDFLYRCEIDGGHLYRNVMICMGEVFVTMIFVPISEKDPCTLPLRGWYGVAE